VQIADSLVALAEQIARHGDARRGAQLIGAAYAYFAEMGPEGPASRRLGLRRIRAKVRAILGYEAYDQEMANGARLGLVKAVDSPDSVTPPGSDRPKPLDLAATVPYRSHTAQARSPFPDPGQDHRKTDCRDVPPRGGQRRDPLARLRGRFATVTHPATPPSPAPVSLHEGSRLSRRDRCPLR
jgi:hypothetical protein